MFYIEQDNKIILFDENLETLQNTLEFKPELEGVEILETDKEIVAFDGEFYFADDEEYIEKSNKAEQERIQELYMTRSDFFDGTIQAWGVGQDELLVLIQNLLATLPIENVKKLIAVNNFKNALNFYRKHDLFTMLSNIPIPLTETMQVTITSEHWDKFFDETNKKNPEAYKELPTPEIIENTTPDEASASNLGDSVESEIEDEMV